MSPASSTVTIPLEIDCTTAEKVASSAASRFPRSRSSVRAPWSCSARQAASAPESRNAEGLRTTVRSKRPTPQEEDRDQRRHVQRADDRIEIRLDAAGEALGPQGQDRGSDE